MIMKTIELVCKHCNAPLILDKEDNVAFCKYCGSQIVLDEEIKKSEHIRKIQKKYTNSADLVRAEAYRNFLEKIPKIAVMFIFTFVVIILALVLYIKNEQSKVVYITMPASSAAYEEYDNYMDVVEELENIGFDNVIAVKGMYEIPVMNVMAKPGEVVKVVVNGERLIAGDEYRQDVRIVVTYYSKD